MTTLLFPGRHLVNTRFQQEYLFNVLQRPLEELEFISGHAPAERETLDQIVFAITSSNQEGSRYNPIAFHVRAVSVDRFARQFRESLHINYRIVGIPRLGHSNRFAENTIKEIEEQTEGDLVLTPQNTIVLCSTPEIIPMYAKLGFSILPAELASVNPPSYRAKTPIEIVKMFAEEDGNWQANPKIREELAPATFSVWVDFPEVPARVQRLYQEPLLTDSGSLTEERDYSTYAYRMSNTDIIKLKYDDVKDVIVPGKIVDEGCADGALLTFIAKDFPDSDLTGIELTGEFIARCRERQRAGEFRESYVHFHQRNITRRIFRPGSIDTTICNSTTHELWSYGNQEETVRAYLKDKFRQTKKNGRLVVRDVVGPENKEQEVYMLCRRTDGSNEDIYKSCANAHELEAHLDSLSTYARFQRFAEDFLAEKRNKRERTPDTKIEYREETIDGQAYIVLHLKDAVEFLSKKKYTNNWSSELNEEFTFWSFNDWKRVLAETGFTVIENPNEPEKGSRAYTNQWIVDNHYNGAQLYTMNGQGLEKMNFPVTNMVLVGEKR